jgi:hypothetical protein
MTTFKEDSMQGDQIWRIFAQWVFVYFRQFLKKLPNKVAHFVATFSLVMLIY